MKKIIAISILAALVSAFTLSAQVDRSKAPAPGPAPKVELGEFEKFTLKNGLRVILVEDHERPIVNLALNFIVDPFVEGDKTGMSSFFGSIWDKGTKNRTAEQLSEEVDFLGATLVTSPTQIGFRTLKKHTGRLMEIMSDVLLNPTFPQDELDKIKDQALGALQMQRTSPDAILSNIRTATVYPKDHAYGDIMTEATVNAITVNDCRSYYKKYIIPNRAILVVIGDITLDELKTLCNDHLRKWKKGKVSKVSYPEVNRPEGIEVVFSPKDASVQSSISMFAPIDLKPGSPDILPLSLANAIYGGGDFSAKLMKNLRETKGYTYGAYSSVGSDLVSASFSAEAEVNGNATDSSFVEMRRELQSMLDGEYTEADLKKFKTMYAGSFSRSLESAGTLATYAYNIERYGFPEDYYETYLQRLDAVTMDDIKRVVAKYFDPDNMYWFVVGDPSVVPALAAYDSDGVVVELDYEGKPIVKQEVSSDVTVETVLDAYLNAIGGRELASDIRDIRVSNQMSIGGMTVDVNQTVLFKEGRMSMTQSMGGMVLMSIEVYPEKIIITQGGASQEITDPSMIQMVASEYLSYPVEEVLTAEDGFVFSLEGIENLNGRNVYKVKCEQGGAISYNYYDVETALKVKTVSVSEGTTQEAYFSDYKPVNTGLLYPMTQSTTDPQMGQITATVTSIEVNTGLTSADL